MPAALVQGNKTLIYPSQLRCTFAPCLNLVTRRLPSKAAYFTNIAKLRTLPQIHITYHRIRVSYIIRTRPSRFLVDLYSYFMSESYGLRLGRVKGLFREKVAAKEAYKHKPL